MVQRLSSLILPLAILGVVAFVWLSSETLPATVASHFDAAGRATSFVNKAVYTYFMMGMSAGLPLVVGWVPGLAIRAPGARINIPNRDYWLSPEFREQTIDYLGHQMRIMGIMTVMFLGYAHRLVIWANHQTPPALPTIPFLYGLGFFLIATVVWLIALVSHFRRPS